MANSLKLVFHPILTTISKVLRRAGPLPPPSASPPVASFHNEAMAPPVQQPQQAAVGADQHNNLDWPLMMIGSCLPSAVDIAMQSLQAQSQLPPMLHFLCLAIILSFNFLFVGKFISLKFPKTAKVLERVGVFFAATAIFAAITIPLPLGLKCFIWSLYVISIIAIIIIYMVYYRI